MVALVFQREAVNQKKHHNALTLYSPQLAQFSRLDVRRPSSFCGRPSTTNQSFSSRSRADTGRASYAASDLDDAIESAASLIIQTVESCAGSMQLRLRRETDSLMQNIAILHLALEDERDREEAVAPPPSLDQLRSSSSQLRVMRCAAESRVHFPQ